jgi:hypothetical protein
MLGKPLTDAPDIPILVEYIRDDKVNVKLPASYFVNVKFAVAGSTNLLVVKLNVVPLKAIFYFL